ncbi:MAG: ATP-binding protein [Planctomycetaceae bacterium]|nr:ATP-binding protein [Planctomycetaceae bacterium]
MLTLIEALNYRCLRYIRQPLGPFHVLVGPNASGKTTFLDVVVFLGKLVSDGLEAALSERSPNFDDLTWGRAGGRFELAIEAKIPDGLAQLVSPVHKFTTTRFEVALNVNQITGENEIAAETVVLKESATTFEGPRSLFPNSAPPPGTIVESTRQKGTRTIIRKTLGGNDNFYSEVYKESGKGWVPSFKLGPRKSALGNLPEDESKFPVAIWLKKLLAEGVSQIMLDSRRMRLASPPGQVRAFNSDGSNLPWVVEDLRRRNEPRYRDWIAHLRTALPDLREIETIERADDKHRYLMLEYDGGLRIPSWTASDGTLRLLALTLPAYLPELSGIFLIEEPENGIHPRAVETLFQSLSNVYDSQILLATHSPVILSIVEPKDVLCFAKKDGATDIVRGSEHPALEEWRGETSLGVLFASGVLG